MSKPWLLLHATRAESAPLRRKGILGDSAHLCQIGVGVKAAEKNIIPYLEKFSENEECFVIHFGISGGLTSDLAVGDLVFADRFVDEKNQTVLAWEPLAEQAGVIAKKIGLKAIVGTLLTSPVILRTRDEKREAAARHEAIAVDMETYPVARLCVERGIPFLSARAIFDPLSWDVSPLTRVPLVDENGNTQPKNLPRAFVKSPRLIFKLPSYQRAFTVASRNLSQFLLCLLKTRDLVS